MTGRGAGHCAGGTGPGYQTSGGVLRTGLGLARWVGGRLAGGRGRGYRRWFYATGLPTWARGRNPGQPK